MHITLQDECIWSNLEDCSTPSELRLRGMSWVQTLVQGENGIPAWTHRKSMEKILSLSVLKSVSLIAQSCDLKKTWRQTFNGIFPQEGFKRHTCDIGCGN